MNRHPWELVIVAALALGACFHLRLATGPASAPSRSRLWLVLLALCGAVALLLAGCAVDRPDPVEFHGPPVYHPIPQAGECPEPPPGQPIKCPPPGPIRHQYASPSYVPPFDDYIPDGSDYEFNRYQDALRSFEQRQLEREYNHQLQQSLQRNTCIHLGLRC